MSANLQNNPLVNRMPGEGDTLPAMFRSLFNLHGLDLEKMIPAKIVAYDRVSNLATVQPMVMIVDVSDNTHSRKQIANIPVLSMGGGGFHISFPMKQGDLGWILAADRDISLFLQSLKESGPNTLRKHSFGDALFVPDVFRQYTINAADSAAMVIQSTDGATRVSISPGNITITAPTGVKVDTPKATFTHDVEIQGNLQVDLDTVVNGGFSATSGSAAVTLPSQSKIGGITVATHGHISSTAGTRTSGNMIT